MRNATVTQNVQMHIESLFSDFPQDSQVWIYQANRCLSHLEIQQIQKLASTYARSWSAHGQPVTADAVVVSDYFLVFAVDDRSHASGCSIDSSVAFVKQLEEQFQLCFFDRMQIVIDKSDHLEQFHATEIKLGLKNGFINPNSHFFDNSISTVKDLKSVWRKEIAGSWLAPNL